MNSQPSSETATVGAVLAAAAHRQPGSPGLVVGSRTLTFVELWEASGRLATGLLGLGLRRGDRVTTSLPNGIEWVVTAYALARIGVVNVLANPRYRPAELEWLVENSGSRLVIGESGLDAEGWAELAATSADGAALAAAAAREVAAAEVLYIIYTSGTTGRPKGSMTRHGAALRNAFNSGERQGFSASDRLLCYLPMSHCFGAVNALLNCLTHGATLVLEADFDAGAVLEAVARHRVTAVYGVPTHYIMLLEALDPARREGLATLRRGCVGGGEIFPDLAQGIEHDLGLAHLTNAYGMTESTAIISQTDWRGSLEDRLGSTGRPLPDVEVRLVDEAGGPAAPKEAGEIHIRGFNVHAGYFNLERDPSARPDGWWATGDLGVVDETEGLRILGRSKDMYKTSGFNVYPVEVENLLVRHPDVAEVAVVGVPDRRKLEAGAAFVVLRPGGDVSPEAVCAHVREELAGYKVPDHVFFVPELPRSSATLKVQKHELRDMAAGLLASRSRNTAPNDTRRQG